MAEKERTPLNEKSTIEEAVRYFRNGKKLFEDICIAYQGMTWEEHTRLMGRATDEDAE